MAHCYAFLLHFTQTDNDDINRRFLTRIFIHFSKYVRKLDAKRESVLEKSPTELSNDSSRILTVVKSIRD